MTPPNLPHRIAVLCYLHDENGRLLLLHRTKDPNCGMYSPIGGKLEVTWGESPHQCAVREIAEEAGITVATEDLHLTGIVAETAYEGRTHWLIFVFEVMRPIREGEIVEMTIDEGTLEWVAPADVPAKPIPLTDREIMWPLFRDHRGGFFVVHIDCTEGDDITWTIEQSTRTIANRTGRAGSAPCSS
ncbi:MAG: NUDIX hydrolase [Planctomycetota bacterium]|jgi:8-oxo-dGTP diphosphatase